MQKPHWSPCFSENASWIGCSAPSARRRPSTVVSSCPSAWTASIRQERTLRPSSEDRAGAADAVLAAEVRAGQAELVAQEVGERDARLGRAARCRRR